MVKHIIKNNNNLNNTQMAYIGLEPKPSHTIKYPQPLELVLFHVIAIHIKCLKGSYYPHLLNNYLINYLNFSGFTRITSNPRTSAHQHMQPWPFMRHCSNSGTRTHLHFSATTMGSTPSTFLPPPRQPRNLRVTTHDSQTLMERLPWHVVVSQWTVRKSRLVNQSTLARVVSQL